MNTYEFLLLLAHLGATPEHIKHAGTKAREALDAGQITHSNNAVEWLNVSDFDTAPGGPLQWVAYGYQLMRLPPTWVIQGLPDCEERTNARNYLGAPSFVAAAV